MPSGTKRRNSRYVIKGQFEGSELPSFHGRKKAVMFRGQVKNISRGGFCLVAPRAPKQSVLLQGPLKLAHMPAQIPTLVQVRWINGPSRGQKYTIGLQYVL